MFLTVTQLTAFELRHCAYSGALVKYVAESSQRFPAARRTLSLLSIPLDVSSIMFCIRRSADFGETGPHIQLILRHNRAWKSGDGGGSAKRRLSSRALSGEQGESERSPWRHSVAQGCRVADQVDSTDPNPSVPRGERPIGLTSDAESRRPCPGSAPPAPY